ncbi:MAG: AarF/ABC1/UbiB kinase family protein [Methanobacterium sp.]|nr:AarF/ABC1/UbiB kinase family protein [Methanobacterium sp.]
MNIGPFQEEKPDFKRVREIVGVLAKYQFGNLLERLGLKKKFNIPYISSGKLNEELDNTAPERLRLVLEELGTTFIKLGQVLSTRPDLAGKDVADELVKLQDEVPPFDFQSVKNVVETELEDTLENLFKEFQEEPIASASIAQVHEASLKDGTRVAVKVQRNNLEDQINKDIVIMRYLARLVERRIKNLKYYNIPGIVDEFERVIAKEMDFELEARNIENFRSYFHDDNHVCAPQVYSNYSTSKVLTMDYIDGVKITQFSQSKYNIDPQKIAEIGTECYFKQIYMYGFFHGDPHPGNLLILPNNTLCFVDFGIVGHLDKEFMDNLAELFVYTVNYDIKGMINQLRYMRLIDDDTDIEELKFDLIDLMDKYYGAEIKDIGGLITEFSKPNILVKHKIKLPRDFILLGRVLSMAEDLGVKLDPNFNGIEVARPLIKKLLKKRLNPLRLLDYQTQYLFELEHIIKDMPETINKMFLRIDEGKIRTELEFKELDKFSHHLEKITNRLTLGLIVSSLIIGSALILQTDKGMPMPVIGFSTVGLVIFLIAAVFALIITISILRTRE